MVMAMAQVRQLGPRVGSRHRMNWANSRNDYHQTMSHDDSTINIVLLVIIIIIIIIDHLSFRHIPELCQKC